ncbi:MULTISPECIES: MBL fold metallo-hydrolase [unclassified Achromobacter]|uniref:MBL fold metallo-hydrolase n=1 Tax=unclassified Achromobacter TaxID=2626865 RepID=UPI000B5165DE|nr:MULTISPECIES: MBL fold metallo-hydrolase [unclassified Achromobacter]OWT80194.1 MBL fold metallo-hydrolase [Achromobacter sp. HZ34]OWT82077.1 MBL fold metallo-hydrolase [Achromobacter sp. HZ28]
MQASTTDPALALASTVVDAAIQDVSRRPEIHSFFDESTFTVSHIVVDPGTSTCAVIDSVLDYDAASGRTATRSVQRLIDFIQERALRVEWVLETHVHADHLSAAPLLNQRLGGRLAIGAHIDIVQDVFGKVFNAGTDFARDGSQFDHLFTDGEAFSLGHLHAVALHVPGHTPACMAYVIGNAVFVGDTLFMPDYGTARCDFPGGDAAALYRSIRRLMGLPDATRVFLCHDYKAPGRGRYVWETTIAAQRQDNLHVHDGVSEQDFVALREQRDAGLAMPRLILPSVQVNMRAGKLPEPESNGVRYLKIPLDSM